VGNLSAAGRGHGRAYTRGRGATDARTRTDGARSREQNASFAKAGSGQTEGKHQFTKTGSGQTEARNADLIIIAVALVCHVSSQRLGSVPPYESEEERARREEVERTKEKTITLDAFLQVRILHHARAQDKTRKDQAGTRQDKFRQDKIRRGCEGLLVVAQTGPARSRRASETCTHTRARGTTLIVCSCCALRCALCCLLSCYLACYSC
jgi:hypothetical protein